MTTLYRPVLIESAEQAEALPLGMVATSPIVDAVAIRVGYGLGWSVSGDEMSDMHAHMVGWTALVPVEAEEEVVEKRRLCQESPDVLHRYVTGWQHYTAKEQNR